ncbi:hypothetical protein SAMN05216503_3348 [Polaribacter sp. KT25b]|uniref:hypothetical protein n=1 Tax=Polaribacter sp. KT25b TaxID=1855336 RepID=UPI0008798B18|nr:hypothetical protein [Polaribacter sp. KT25b]SDS52791.1 hypothetical protein SAMN05216503_3348 [Polaribacter sp. KT25b]
MSESKKIKDLSETAKEKTTEFVTDTKIVYDVLKNKLNESLTEENVKNSTVKTAKLAKEASEQLQVFADEAKDELIEISKKSKVLFQKLFRK